MGRSLNEHRARRHGGMADVRIPHTGHVWCVHHTKHAPLTAAALPELPPQNGQARIDHDLSAGNVLALIRN